MDKLEDIPTTDPAQIEQLIERLRRNNLEPHEVRLIERLLRTFLSLVSLLEEKRASIKRLKQMIFGAKTEKRKAKPKPDAQSPPNSGASAPPSAPPDQSSTESSASAEAPEMPPQPKEKDALPGHGRRGAKDHPGAKVIQLFHTKLQAGDRCPDPDCRGCLHRLNKPSPKIYLTGHPVVSAARYDREVLRCTECEAYFRAELPEGVPETGKYDATADVAIVMFKYGGGMPFYRQARLQESCGVPVAESVQFERCEFVADVVLVVYKLLRRLGADGRVFHSDDTTVVILACVREDQALEEGKKNRATYTTGMVIKCERWMIALYESGRRHSGENLDQVLEKRSEGLETPIQVGDASSNNWSRESETIEAKCVAHGRRKFTDIEESFPVECEHVLLALAKVYGIDAETKEMSDAQRLAHHQTHSRPILDDLHEWIEAQFRERRVEPNSLLGKSLQYCLNHWEGLTCFLKVAGAPLDNNLAEQALKRFVLFRKNSLFYKTPHGAGVGDILMSLIETCRLNNINAWEYLVTLVRNADRVKENPSAFLPWNYARGEPAETAEARAA
jgi:transposase